MSAQHTPGPWHVVHEKDGIYVMAGDFYIAETFDSAGEESDDTTQYANARLIAAAPDLLEALQEMLPTYVDITVPSTFAADKARAAIAKATGAT